MSNIVTSALAQRLFLQKQHTSGQYSTASKVIGSHSQSLAKVMGDFSTIDNGQAALIQGYVIPALEREGQAVGVAVRAETYHMAIDMTATKPDEAENKTIEILEGFVSVEHLTMQLFKQAAGEPAAEEISFILSLEMIATVSAARCRELQRLAESIRSGAFWEGGTQWHCLRCGHVHRSASAFDTCACCAAPRAFASA